MGFDCFMKIAVVHNVMNTFGGAERVILRTAEILTEKGDEVVFFTTDYQESKTYPGFRNFEVRVPKNISTRSEIMEPYYLLRKIVLFNRLDMSDFDVIIANNFPACTIVFKYPEKTVFCLYDALHKEMNMHKKRSLQRGILRFYYSRIRAALITWLLRRWVIPRSKHVLCNSSYVMNDLVSNFGRPHRCEVNYSGVDLDKYNAGVSNKNVLVVARLEDEKRVDLSIKTLPFLPQDFTLTICGDGRQREVLQRLVNELGLRDRVIFEGRVPEDRLLELYSNCFCVLCTAEDEDFGLVPLEAMASSKPVVCVEEGGFIETVDTGFNGFLSDDDPKSLSEKITLLINDASLYEKMSKNAARTAKKFSWDTSVRKLQSVLNSVSNT